MRRPRRCQTAVALGPQHLGLSVSDLADDSAFLLKLQCRDKCSHYPWCAADRHPERHLLASLDDPDYANGIFQQAYDQIEQSQSS